MAGSYMPALHSRVPLALLCGLFFAPVVAAQAVDHSMFATSDQCIACHSNLTDEGGVDVSIGHAWRASMMAHSALDPYWQASVRREIMDHPGAQEEIEDTCSTCHMPMARTLAKALGGMGKVFEHLAAAQQGDKIAMLALDGVSCTTCHQIRDDNFGDESSFDGNFVIRPSADPQIFGPFEVDDGLRRVMQSSSGFTPQTGTHIQQSELCATCHTLFTTSLDGAGRNLSKFPEQVPYLEWRHSLFAEAKSCQDCHMPEVGLAPIASVLGEPREGFSEHAFRGGNEFMLRLLDQYRDELLVKAPSADLRRAAAVTRSHLQNATAKISVLAVVRDQGRFIIDLKVENLAGHKLPTAYPSRRAWIHLQVFSENDDLLFESGAMSPDGQIQGNNNDTNASSFEPHYEEISSPDQVQIYEPIIADASGRVTTSLLKAASYLKDNRLLPRGFDKTTAEDAVKVRGGAEADRSFAAGGDEIRFSVSVAPEIQTVRVRARLMFQTIGFRWVRNLSPYESFETQRFVGYYDAEASTSAVVLSEVSF